MMQRCQYKNHIVFTLSQLLPLCLGSVLLVDCKQTLRETERLVTFVQTNNLEWSKLCLSPDWSWYFTLYLGNIISTVESNTSMYNMFDNHSGK